MKTYQTRYFFIQCPDDISFTAIADKLRSHWWQDVEIDYVLDAILHQVMEKMGMFPMIADKIILRIQREPLPVQISAFDGKPFDTSAIYENGTITAEFKDFGRDEFQHECSHAVIDYAVRGNLRVSRRVEEVIAEWVDSQL